MHQSKRTLLPPLHILLQQINICNKYFCKFFCSKNYTHPPPPSPCSCHNQIEFLRTCCTSGLLSASLQQQLSSKCPSKTFCEIKARLRHRHGSGVSKRAGRGVWRPEELLQLANKVTTEAEIIGNVHILQPAGASSLSLSLAHSSYAERIQRPVQN